MAAKHPESKYEWQLWQAAVRDTFPEKVAEWLPGNIRINWPEDLRPSVGPGWIPLAEDHPFKGHHFCWRCVAEAQGFPTGGAPHKRDAICWGAPEAVGIPEPLEAGPSAEDSQPKQTARVRVELDSGQVIHAERAWFQRLDKEGRPVGERQALHTPPFTGLEPPEPWDGFPSWRDIEATAPIHEPPWYITEDGRYAYATPTDEPAASREPVRKALDQAEPVQAHEAEDADRQPGSDEAS